MNDCATDTYLDHWNFPGSTPRPQQIDTLGWIGNKVDGGAGEPVALICELPTGVGKSAISMTVAARDSGVILVPTKLLQDQVTRDWPDVPLMKGQKNYSCGEHSIRGEGGSKVTCEHGRARGCKGAGCPYKLAKDDFVTSSIAVTNYAWFFASMMGPDFDVSNKKWILFDEAHVLPEQLIAAAELTVKVEDLKLMKLTDVNWPTNYDEACDLAEKMDSAARLTMQALKSDKHKNAANIVKLERMINSLSYFNGNKNEEEWIYIPDNFKEDSFTMRVLSARGLYNKFIEPLRKNILMTSATLPGSRMWSRWTGIAQDQVSRITIPSPFYENNRKIHYWPAADMSYKSLQTGGPMRQMAERLGKLLDSFHDSKGIIHTSSFKITEQLMAEMDRKYLKRLLIQDRNVDRDAILIQHQLSKEPTVLVSPSMVEGLDLKDDLSRFCVFVKVPYPPLQDPWIKRMMQLDDDWYGWQTMKAIIQGAGRSVRSINDYADTYILDSQFEQYFDRCKGYAPKWFRDSIDGL